MKKQLTELKLTELPKWIKLSKKRFHTIKYVVQNAKTSNLQSRPLHSSPINSNESNKLMQDITYGDITHEKTLNKMAGINNNF